MNAATAKVSATITLIGSAIAPANLVLLDGASFNFGRVLKNMAIEKRLFIQNTGEEMASNLVPAILPPPFIYTNGTFPGTLDSRHCGDSLSGKTTCIVSISMKPADIGKRETAWDLQYRSETGQKELNIVLSGEGIESPNTSQGLDQTFGNSGKVIQSISGNPESIISLALQNISGQSRIIVLEETQRGINRYQANGDPDLTFGTNGTRSLGTLFSTVSAIAAGADGTLFLAGTRAGPYGYADFAFTKISADGNLATPSPPRQLDFYAGHTDIPYAIAIQPYPLGQRKILIAGYWAGSYGNGQAALVRFWEDGTMDTTFDGDGKKLVGITAKEDRAYALHILPGTATDCSDCKILIAGKGGDDFFLAKLNINGSLDSSCSGDGIAFAGFSGSSGFTQSYHAAYAMAVQEDGKIVLAGVANPMDKARDFGLARFNPDCSLDTTFGNGGRTTAGFSGGIAKAVVIQSNGKIWVVGEVGIGSGNTSFGIARFLPTGDLDAGVNGNGRLSIDFGKVTERPQAMIFSDSGMPLVGGFVQDTSTDKRQILAQYFSPEFSTWNPNDKSQNIQLDIEKLTASVDPPPVSGLVRGTLGIRTGKSYFEIRVDKLGDELLDRGLGIATKKLALSGILGEQDWGCAYQPLGEVICLFGDLLKTNGFSPFLETDVIGVAYDGSHVYFSKNGVWQAGADPEKGMGGIPVQSESLYPDFFPGANVSDGDIFTINTGKTPFRYGPPHGFRAGWY